jgi:glucosyl-3-phosphoglycerate synthase
VTELMAKPLLNFFRPELTGFVQPLAGEFAARRELFEAIPFVTGYGVEIGILVDVLDEVGLPAMAQVDLGHRQNRHQPLWDLTRMSSTVLRGMASRAHLSGRGMLNRADTGVWGMDEPETYLHAVATDTGLRLDEHLSEMLERPPLTGVLAGPGTALGQAAGLVP